MKKMTLVIIILIIVSGCSKNDKFKQSNDKNNEESVEKNEEKVENTYQDNNPIILGLYLYNGSNSNRTLKETYQTTWTLNVDLCSLEVYYTDDSEIPGTNLKELWNTYYQNYQNIDSYKIGYEIEFNTQDKQINKTILSPGDTKEIYDYIQIYLYDDINQTSSWYDHVEQSEYNDSTLLTSIKLTGSTKTDQITSDIKLTVFTYDQDDFDENNNYRGISKFTTTIKKV